MALSSQLRITIIAESRQAIRALEATQSAVAGIGTSADAANKRLIASNARAIKSNVQVAQSVAAIDKAYLGIGRSKAAALDRSLGAMGASAIRGPSFRPIIDSFTKIDQLARQTARTLPNFLGKASSGFTTLGNAASKFSSKLSLSNANSFTHLRALQAMPNAMMRWGKSMQWVGRVMETRITFPLVALTGFAAYFGFSFEKAMTRIRKVYGDAATDITDPTVVRELSAISDGILAISSSLGVNAEEVGEVGAAWAQAGAEGSALLELTRLTSEVSLLGDMDLMQSQQGLVTIMSAYKLNVEELTEAIAMLNMVENETPAGMADLIEVIQTAGATAAQTGVAMNELAGFAAALIPATGSANEVGNMLKSIMPRIMTPTKEAADAMNQLGLNISETEWRSRTFTERLDTLIGRYRELSTAEQSDVTRRIAQLRQNNKFVALIADMSDGMGRYEQTLRITGDTTQNLATYQEELRRLLESSPQQLSIAWNKIRNQMILAVTPILPMISGIIGMIAKAFYWFNQLDSSIRNFALAFGVALALLGPFLGYLGTLAQLASRLFALVVYPIVLSTKAVLLLGQAVFGVVGIALKGIGAILGALKLLGLGIAAVAGAGPLVFWGLAIAAAAAVIFMMGAFGGLSENISSHLKGIRDMFAAAWQGVVEIVTTAVNALPEAVANAMRAVVNIIRTAALAIYSWLSYLNPFATHSPSIVDEVERGAKTIAEQYQGLARSLGVGVKVPILGMFSAHVQKAPMGTPAFAAGGKLPTTEVGSGFKTDGIRGIVGEGSQYPEYVIPTDPKYRRRAKQLTVSAAEDVGLYASGGLLPRLRDALSGVREQVRSAERSETIQIAIDLGVSVDVIGEAIDQLHALERVLESVQEELDAQQWVVDYWKRELDEAVDSVKAAEKVLDSLKDTVSDLEKQLTESRDRMSDWLDAPLEGSYAFEDALFANGQAQKSTQLELLRLEQSFADAGWTIQEVRSWVEDNATAMDSAQDSASGLADAFDTTGMSVDDILAKINALNAEIDQLRGRENNLRLAGAGSDVLAGIRSQISDAEAARKALAGSIGAGGSSAPPQALVDAMSAVEDFEEQLADLGRQGQIIDLEQALALEPLQNEIEKTQRIAEQSFAAIMAGVSAETIIINGLEGALATANSAMEAQQAVVDRLVGAKDVLQAIYDEEVASLDAIQARYDLNADAASKLRAEIDLLTSAHSNLISASAGGGAGGGGGGIGLPADWESTFGNLDLSELAGGGKDMRKNIAIDKTTDLMPNPDFGKTWAEIWVENFSEEMDGAFDGLDPFKGLRGAWNGFVAWWDQVWTQAKISWDRFTGGINVSWADLLIPAIAGVSVVVGILTASFIAAHWAAIAAGAPFVALAVALGVVAGAFVWAYKNVEWFRKSVDLVVSGVGAVIGGVGAVVGAILGIKIPDVLMRGMELIVTVWKEMLSWGLDLPGLWGSIQKAFESVSKELGPLKDALGELWNAVQPLIKPLLVIAGVLTGVLLTAIALVVGSVLKMATMILRVVIPAFGSFLGGVIRFITGIVKVITGFVQIIAGIFTLDWQKIWDGAVNVISGFIEMIKAPFSALKDVVFGVFTSIWGIIRDLGIKIYESLQWLNPFASHSPSLVSQIQAFPAVVFAAFTSIVTWLAGLPAKLLSSLLSMATLFVAKGRALITGMYNGVIAGWTTLWTWLTGLAGRIVTAVGVIGTALAQKGTQLITGFYAAILVKYTDVRNWFLGLKEKIKSAIGNALLTLKQTGRNILQGLWNGINDKWQWVRSKIVGLAEKIKSAINFVFRSKSPSREMMDTGNSIMQGLALGVKQGYPDAAKQITGLMAPLMNPGQFTAKSEVLNSSGGSRTFIINGNLSFPSIKDDSSVELWIDELEALAS